MNAYVLLLDDNRANLATVGGKGASLATLKRSGLPVPDGFHISTQAYKDFVKANMLEKLILEKLKKVDCVEPQTFEEVSIEIRSGFLEAGIPEAIRDAIREAYPNLGVRDGAVAVRSSATAEDLPEASFAGQQETYLNVRGSEEVLEAVKKCWASLWTARAIAYRMKNHIDQSSIALAVVVQEMVLAESAGVMFTANPLNGRQDEVLVNATWGLGEALVSGSVSPDSIVVEKNTGAVKDMKIAKKENITVPAASGTVEKKLKGTRRKRKVLNSEQIRELAALGKKIEQLYNQPQDIEWCLSAGGFSVVQSRPITSLPAAPSQVDWTLPNPKGNYFRGSLAEHLPNPASPLFGSLGLRAINGSTNELAEMMNMDLRQAQYQYILLNGYVYMAYLLNFKFVLSMVKVTLQNYKLMYTQAGERWRQAHQDFADLIAKFSETEPEDLNEAQILEHVYQIMYAAGKYYTVIQSGTLPSASTSEMVFSRIYKSLKDRNDPDASQLLVGSDSVAMRAEKSLFDLNKWIQNSSSLQSYIMKKSSAELAVLLEKKEIPARLKQEEWIEFRERFTTHLEQYGQTSYDYDFMNPAPAEMPAVSLDALKLFLEGKGSDPYHRQLEAEERRSRVTQKILSKRRPLLKRWFQKALKWALECAPLREDSLADMGMGHALIRRLLTELGRRLTAGGVLKDPQDIYWLKEAELIGLTKKKGADEKITDYGQIIAERKQTWKEQLRISPPAILPENSPFAKMVPWSRQNKAGSIIRGVAASAGRVTASARVLYSPEDFNRMQPGDVLVAVTTTPAWTPLFSMASAIVTDIGGPLSHSSIVAREYGIPAVLATGSGTRLIQDGQTITVDGDAGTVTLLSM